MVAGDLPVRPLALAGVAVSLLIGAWTHIAWDALTHNNGWLVLRLPLLQAPLFYLGGGRVHVYNVLQHFSTCLGVAVIAVVYWRWLQRNRDFVLAAVAAIAILVAVSAGAFAAAKFQGYYAWSKFLFRAAVDGMSAFVVLYLLSSVLCYCARPRMADAMRDGK